MSAPGEPPTTIADDPGGRVLANRFRLLEQLGSGGFGEVWLAEQTLLGTRAGGGAAVRKQVAIKLLNLHEPAALGTFRHEIALLSALEHPSICRVIDAGIDPDTGEAWFAMEHADGGSLADWLQDRGRADLATVTTWLLDAARGIAAAHAADIIHCDIKPSNLLLRRPPTDRDAGDLIVADFGIGRRDTTVPPTRPTAGFPHTPLYASPEQRTGQGPLTAATDQYSLGVTFVHALTGTPPVGDGPHDPRRLRRDVPAALAQLLMRMTQPLPERRCRNLAEVVTTLTTIVRHRRTPWLWRTIAVGVAAIAAVIADRTSAPIAKPVVAAEAGDRPAPPSPSPATSAPTIPEWTAGPQDAIRFRNLIWQRNPVWGTFADAEAAIARGNADLPEGVPRWRLPRIDELRLLPELMRQDAFPSRDGDAVWSDTVASLWGTTVVVRVAGVELNERHPRRKPACIWLVHDVD